MNNKFIDELSHLRLREKAIKRNLDIKYYDKNLRTKLFDELKDVKNKINIINFKINLQSANDNVQSANNILNSRIKGVKNDKNRNTN